MILYTALLPDVQSDPAYITLYTSLLPDVQSDPAAITLYTSLLPDVQSDPADITLGTFKVIAHNSPTCADLHWVLSA